MLLVISEGHVGLLFRTILLMLCPDNDILVLRMWSGLGVVRRLRLPSRRHCLPVLGAACDPRSTRFVAAADDVSAGMTSPQCR